MPIKKREVGRPRLDEDLQRKFRYFDMMVKGEMAQIAFVKEIDYEFPDVLTLEEMFRFAESVDFGMEVRWGPKEVPPTQTGPGGVPISQGHTQDPTAVAVSSAELEKIKAKEAAKKKEK